MDSTSDAPEAKLELRLDQAQESLRTFETRLRPFLWDSRKKAVKQHVLKRETASLVDLLDRFQEQPQLLDSHLQKFIPLLADAFLEYLRLPDHTHTNGLLYPLSQAICLLLYTLCKIRGEKVIVRFLTTETKHLELLMSALENGGQVLADSEDSTPAWSWEERYITLLWLSQLLLVPFDLASISSWDHDAASFPNITHLTWPHSTPGLTVRVVTLAIHYLVVPSKEKDAAKTLLVRVALRSDMQKIGLLDSLVTWAISAFYQKAVIMTDIHHSIGLLYFLAGMLVSSAGTNDMDKYLPQIFQLAQQIAPDSHEVFPIIYGNSVARKLSVKIFRAIAILDLRNDLDEVKSERLQSTVGCLLEYISDSQGPVRLAASKSLSMITLKLEPEMSSQVIDALLDKLSDGINWDTGKAKTLDLRNYQGYEFRDANDSLWHGLILTLSHLLYRRAVPAFNLAPVLAYLIAGLSFEKRDALGISKGYNVRDAACFGIWALARRYSTSEIKSVTVDGIFEAAFQTNLLTLSSFSEAPVVQGLAVELLISACLDPAGNIRRGSSAALQELIGRHPDMIVEAINLVRIVDYHAIALRTRAIQDVALHAAAESLIYGDALSAGLLGWRCVRDNSAVIRRSSALCLGLLINLKQSIPDGHCTCFTETVLALRHVLERLTKLPRREVNESHGLLLSAASIIGVIRLTGERIKMGFLNGAGSPVQHAITTILELVLPIFNQALADTEDRKPREMSGEGLSRLMISIIPILQADISMRWLKHYFSPAIGGGNAASPQISSKDSRIELIPGKGLPGDGDILLELSASSFWTTDCPTSPFAIMVPIQEAIERGIRPDSDIVALIGLLLNRFFPLKEDQTGTAVSDLAANYLFLLDKNEREATVLGWISEVEVNGNSGRIGDGRTLIRVLFAIFSITAPSPIYKSNSLSLQNKLLEVLQWRWVVSSDIETKTILLECLSSSTAIKSHSAGFFLWIQEGLDDYTNDSRGDIGNKVRIAALHALAAFNDSSIQEYGKSWQFILYPLFGRVLRLAAEKFDKVRQKAQKVLLHGYPVKKGELEIETMDPSSKQYFFDLLHITKHFFIPGHPQDRQWLVSLLEGYVLSMNTATEGVVQASRSALVKWCYLGSDYLDGIAFALMELLKQNLKNDRALVSVLEAISFLFDMRLLQESSYMKTLEPDPSDPTKEVPRWRRLFRIVQRAHFKSKNMEMLKAAVKVYGGLLDVQPEVSSKLTSMLLHPFKTIRNSVAEELYVRLDVGGGVDWMNAEKIDVERFQIDLANKLKRRALDVSKQSP
ncbi:putative tubulin-specific chaperone D [Amylocarpus encephaloides]|uniref:Tubulin-specific chaperone D n=1 Tax=Amylocarpus encephaloides TaxID=45428 RepID=A0A9P8C2S7_9HELO|nr:putative tubulin-specific chaperone D [Amylocarpus encephaloides]